MVANGGLGKLQVTLEQEYEIVVEDNGIVIKNKNEKNPYGLYIGISGGENYALYAHVGNDKVWSRPIINGSLTYDEIIRQVHTLMLNRKDSVATLQNNSYILKCFDKFKPTIDEDTGVFSIKLTKRVLHFKIDPDTEKSEGMKYKCFFVWLDDHWNKVMRYCYDSIASVISESYIADKLMIENEKSYKINFIEIVTRENTVLMTLMRDYIKKHTDCNRLAISTMFMQELFNLYSRFESQCKSKDDVTTLERIFKLQTSIIQKFCESEKNGIELLKNWSNMLVTLKITNVKFIEPLLKYHLDIINMRSDVMKKTHEFKFFGSAMIDGTLMFATLNKYAVCDDDYKALEHNMASHTCFLKSTIASFLEGECDIEFMDNMITVWFTQHRTIASN